MASKDIQQIVDELTAMHDTFFHKLVEDKGFCEELIQTIMGKKSLRLIEATPQKSLRNIKGRSVVLDLYCIDTEKTNYDVEMERSEADDHQRRVRYNASNMDTYMAEKGKKFKDIPDAYVIYISSKDFFGKGQTLYHVDRVLRGTNDVVDNGFHEIYVNAEIDDGSDLAELMKIYKSSAVPENDKFPKTCEGIKNYKVGEGRDIMCELVERYADEKAKEAAKVIARNLLKKGMSVDEVADSVLLLSIDEVAELEEEICCVNQ